MTDDSERPSRRLSFEKIAETEDTGEPVIEARFEDTASFLNVILDQENEVLRVAHVQSNYQGDMKRMMDEIVSQIGWNDVRFLTPLTEFGSPLEDRLEGFEKQTEELPDDAPAKEHQQEIEVLVGTWEVDRDRDDGRDES